MKTFARSAAAREHTAPLGDFARLSAEAVVSAAERPVHWRAAGEERRPAGQAAQTWLHLLADASVPLTCQRCLEPVDVALTVDRWFRFVGDEATAQSEDDDVEEDLLVIDKAFDMAGLVEDELLMALPLVPRHEVCPHEPALSSSDEDFERAQEAKLQPFEVLAQLKRKPG